MKSKFEKITIPAKQLLSKHENTGVRDYYEHISTNDIGNLKITDEINLFRYTLICKQNIDEVLWLLSFVTNIGITNFNRVPRKDIAKSFVRKVYQNVT